ncbi:hypothetical protein KC19_10G071700 [Ceratodon purpureus]|uniref:Golgi apparatus membrane protein TVP15 n=2 Tax=Ceratodon purpureus TaxID=3225 RepID=A0A8T0GKA9_CERPU|nr:hypothetical protein KC19_10G071700 [Ceratodon purpureus]
MGALDFFENLRDGGSEKGEKGESGESGAVGAEEAAAPSAPPVSDQADLEAPLLQQNGTNQVDPRYGVPVEQVPPVLLQAPPPENDSLLYVCRVLSTVTAVGSLLCLVVNAISLLRSFDYRGFDYRVSVFVGILRSYTIAIAVLVIVAETEWELLFRFFGILEFWVGRGLFQILVAALTRVLRRASGETPAESLLHEIASWWLFGCGILYSVAGLLCLGRIKRTHLNKQSRYLQAKRDLEELHRRRADLEDQLARHHD